MQSRAKTPVWLSLNWQNRNHEAPDLHTCTVKVFERCCSEDVYHNFVVCLLCKMGDRPVVRTHDFGAGLGVK